ncbi:MAG: hypothetical protein IKF68_04915 [Erysipelotrichaceae bacterium]|nr:hypothetical protein [Erysipelotrichaceae bacterium]
MKKIITVLCICLLVFGCTGKKEDEKKTVIDDSNTIVDIGSDEKDDNEAQNTSKEIPEGVKKVREDMGGASLAIIYVGSLYGDSAAIQDKFTTFAAKYPYILELDDSQYVYDDVIEDGQVLVYILIPQDGATLSINSLYSGEVLYRDEEGWPVLLFCDDKTADPTVEVNVVDGYGNVATIRPALSLQTGYLRDNMNMQINDFSDHDFLIDNSDVPFYQQSCFDSVTSFSDVANALNNGKKINTMWETEIGGHWYLTFGVGNDPTTSDGIDAFYSARPDTTDIYYSKDLEGWTKVQ